MARSYYARNLNVNYLDDMSHLNVKKASDGFRRTRVRGELVLRPRLVFGTARDNVVATDKTEDSQLWLPTFGQAFVL